MSFYLGIEIGGTKLQLLLGESPAAISERQKLPVDPARGADGIRAQNGAQAVVSDSVVAHNSSVGVFAYVTDTNLQGFTFVTVSRSLLSYNNVGLQTHGAGTGIAYATVSDSTIEKSSVNGVLATQAAGGSSSVYVRRNTIADTVSGADVHVTTGAFGVFDDNWMGGVTIDGSAAADSRNNNTVSSVCCIAPGHLAPW